MPFLRFIANKFMSQLTSKLLSIDLSEYHTGYKIFGKKFYETIPFKNCSNNYLFSFQIILQVKYFNLKYGEISISSSYEGYRQSCGYFNGFIYLLGNFKIIMLYFLAKLNFYK